MEENGFVFDGESLSDYGFILGGNGNADLSWNGGDIEFVTSQAIDSDTLSFHSSKASNSLTATLQIVKNPCRIDKQEDLYVTREEYSSLSRWLCRRDGYHWLQFNHPGYEDIYFNSKISLTPSKVGNNIIGFTVNIETDSPYGYSRIYKKEFRLPYNNGGKMEYTYSFENDSDQIGHIFPKVSVTTLSSSSSPLKFESGIDGNMVTTLVSKINKGDYYEFDGKNDYYNGFNGSEFNFEFPIITNDYPNNRTTKFTLLSPTDSTCNFTVEYRLVRMVTV